MYLSVKVYDKNNQLLNSSTTKRPEIIQKDILNIVDNAIARNNLLCNSSKKLTECNISE